MGTGLKLGLTAAITKGNGNTMKPMELANCAMRMEIFTKGNGSTGKPMEREPIHTQMEPSISAIGSKTSNMEGEWKIWLMAPYMKVTMTKARKKEEGN